MGIQVASRAFTGDSIKIDRLLNKEIKVLYHKIEDSTKKQGTKCLYLQVEFEGQNRLLFTGAQALLEAIQKVPPENFPFTTTIVKNDRYEFT
jgi:hypothetical protein